MALLRKTKLRIVLVNPLLNFVRGGAEINDVNLGSALNDLGHGVIYLACNDTDQWQHDRYKSGKIVNLPISQFDWAALSADGIIGKYRRFKFFLRYANQVCAERPQSLKEADLVLLTGRPSLVRIRGVTNAPVVQSVRGGIGKVNTHFAKQADGLIFWGGSEADNSPRLLSEKATLQVDPGVDESYFYPDAPIPGLERSLRCGEVGALHIVFAGRLDPIKRIDHILRAVSSVVDQGRDAYLSIIGEGSMRSELEKLGDIHLPGRVTFHGQQEPSALSDIFRASDIFMLTSRTENHPIAIKEALACGLDIIAYGVGRVPQLLSKANNSIVVPVGDESRLTRALCQRVDEGRVKARQRVASGAVTWRDVAQEVVSWSERELKHRGEK
jgi:glycosyltransferase involved in cell wall biosynthesis